MVEISPSKYVVQASWDDVPHLDDKDKAELFASIPPWQRDARSKGEPSLGAGAIYPIPISDIEVKPFAPPYGWKRGFALDVGWNRTACIWGMQNPADGVIFLYSEHYKGQQLPVVHANAIKTRGEWIKGCIDPASTGSAQRDGEKLKVEYQSLGLDLINANNELEAGLVAVWQALAFGQLKIFSTLVSWKAEYRAYQRDEKGKIMDTPDHLMDTTRYLYRTWDKIASLPPIKRDSTGSGFRVADHRAGI